MLPHEGKGRLRHIDIPFQLEISIILCSFHKFYNTNLLFQCFIRNFMYSKTSWKTIACRPNQNPCLFVLIKFYWSTATFIPLRIVCGCSCTTVVRLSIAKDSWVQSQKHLLSWHFAEEICWHLSQDVGRSCWALILLTTAFPAPISMLGT